MSQRVLVGFVFVGLLVFGVGPVMSQSRGLALDEIVVQYPEGYTRVLAADLALLSRDEMLKQSVLVPLRAARHPLSGILQTVELFKLNVREIPWVAHGMGLNLTGFSLIPGTSFPQTFGALQGLKAAVGVPNSPYTNWELLEIHGIPVVFVGGMFGPIPIQWAYLPLASHLWVGTETGLNGPPNQERLRTSAERIVARLNEQVGVFSEFIGAYATRGSSIAFVRKTDTLKDKPIEHDEEVMSYAVFFEGSAARIRFQIRFTSEQAAQAALDNLRNGTSSYSSQDLYRATVGDAQRSGRFLDFEVRTDLRGVVGLLVLTMPA